MPALVGKEMRRAVKKMLSIVGARPQFVKLAAISRVIPEGIEHRVIHTGQHYDEAMSGGFFSTLGISDSVINLHVGSGSHGSQTARMLELLEPALTEEEPDWVVIYGDTNSTLAGAVAASKLHLPLVHLEAGLRSFNREMPEEINRVLSDHASDLCLAPSIRALEQLEREGLSHKSRFVGDVMVDVLIQEKTSIQQSPPQLPWETEIQDYAVATFHRQALTSDMPRMKQIFETLQTSEMPVYLATHPRLAKEIQREGINPEKGSLNLVPPMAYREIIWALMNARALVTDSGGLQKEAFILGVPTATIRTETEWTETIDLGWNRLVWNELSDLSSFLKEPATGQTDSHPYGDGHAAQAAVDAILSWRR